MWQLAALATNVSGRKTAIRCDPRRGTCAGLGCQATARNSPHRRNRAADPRRIDRRLGKQLGQCWIQIADIGAEACLPLRPAFNSHVLPTDCGARSRAPRRSASTSKQFETVAHVAGRAAADDQRERTASCPGWPIGKGAVSHPAHANRQGHRDARRPGLDDRSDRRGTSRASPDQRSDRKHQPPHRHQCSMTTSAVTELAMKQAS